MRRILSERLGLSLPRHLLRRVYEIHARQPAVRARARPHARRRAARRRSARTCRCRTRSRTCSGTRVGAAAEAPVRRLLLARRAERRPARAAAHGDRRPDAVEDAVDAGVILLDGDRVRPSHPLLAAAAQEARRRPASGASCTCALARGGRRRGAARAAPGARDERPDEELAATVGGSRRRGVRARRGAARRSCSAEHALRLTPPDSASAASGCSTLAGYLEVAGEQQRVTDLLAPELDSLPPGVPRARAWLLLVRGRCDREQRRDRALPRPGAGRERGATRRSAPRCWREGRATTPSSV